MWELPIAVAGNSEMGWKNIEWGIAASTTPPPKEFVLMFPSVYQLPLMKHAESPGARFTVSTTYIAF